ncbi:hypothetical protein GH733_000600 [Mirounga leonina]|nr:hypothetical protein GH733_000600 [Mirounga leonina]
MNFTLKALHTPPLGPGVQGGMRGEEEQQVELTKGQARDPAAMKEEAAQHMVLTGPDTEVDTYTRHNLTGHSPIQQHQAG